MPTFELVNVGGTPIEILSVSTACGCATVTAEPLVVPPGGKTAVSVKMDPLEVGARAATFTVETDSPISPRVYLQLTQEGYRRPPYVFLFTAELFYQRGYSKFDTREVLVDTVEPAGSTGAPPAVTSDLAFLRFDPLGSKEKPFAADPRMVVRSYRYEVRLVADPPTTAFAGRALVSDPWVPGRVLERNIFGEANPPIHAVPARLILQVDSPDTARSRRAFIARSTRDRGPLTARIADEGAPLILELQGKPHENGYHTYLVRCKPGLKVTDGEYEIIVQADGPESTEQLTIPVLVRGHGG